METYSLLGFKDRLVKEALHKVKKDSPSTGNVQVKTDAGKRKKELSPKTLSKTVKTYVKKNPTLVGIAATTGLVAPAAYYIGQNRRTGWK